jgi:hypothetical protein
MLVRSANKTPPVAVSQPLRLRCLCGALHWPTSLRQGYTLLCAAVHASVSVTSDNGASRGSVRPRLNTRRCTAPLIGVAKQPPSPVPCCALQLPIAYMHTCSTDAAIRLCRRGRDSLTGSQADHTIGATQHRQPASSEAAGGWEQLPALDAGASLQHRPAMACCACSHLRLVAPLLHNHIRAAYVDVGCTAGARLAGGRLPQLGAAAH